MKKYLLIAILSLASIVSSAQINRTFWGTTLGKSTKNQVRTVLVNRGFYVQTEPDGSLAVKKNNLQFGGAYWSYVSFSFVNGYLSQIWFQNNELESPVNLDTVYSKVKISLDKKYHQYYFDIPTNDPNNIWSNYSDGKSSILLGVRKDGPSSIKYISLSYKDEYLSNMKSHLDEDEL